MTLLLLALLLFLAISVFFSFFVDTEKVSPVLHFGIGLGSERALFAELGL